MDSMKLAEWYLTKRAPFVLSKIKIIMNEFCIKKIRYMNSNEIYTRSTKPYL